MKNLNDVLRSVNVLNGLLVVLGVVMFFSLAFPLLSTEIKNDIPNLKKETANKESKTVSKNNSLSLDPFVLDTDQFLYPLMPDVEVRPSGFIDMKDLDVKIEETSNVSLGPSGLDYLEVADKNLFHPERRLPLDNKEMPEVTRPDIIYYGSVITSEKRIAYIEDKKNPYSTPGRGKRQTTVTEGAMLAGYKLTEVNPESIVMVRGDDKIVVNLRDQKSRLWTESGNKPKTPTGLTQSGLISGSQGHTPPPVPHPVSGLGTGESPKPARPIKK